MAFPLHVDNDDRAEQREANRAAVISAIGLTVTGLVELAIGAFSGSAGLFGDAVHNLSDVSTSVLLFVGFRASRKAATHRYPYGYDRVEDLVGVGVVLIMCASAIIAGTESITKLAQYGSTHHIGCGVAAAAVGIVGNQLVARYKLVVGRRIRSATMIADAKHSRLDALSSAGAMLGLIGVALGWGWADAVAGVIVTGFICHVGWKVSTDIARRLLDGVDPEIIFIAQTVAEETPGVARAHARARWTGRTLRVEVEGFLADDTTLGDADLIGQRVAAALRTRIPEMRSFTWTPRCVQAILPSASGRP